MWAALKPLHAAPLARHCIASEGCLRLLPPSLSQNLDIACLPTTITQPFIFHYLLALQFFTSPLPFPSPSPFAIYIPPPVSLPAAAMASVQARDISLDLADLCSRPCELPESMLVNADRVVQDDCNYLQNRFSADQYVHQVSCRTMMMKNAEKWMAAQHAYANNAAQTNERKDSIKLQTTKCPRVQSVKQITSFFNEAQIPADGVSLSLGRALACDSRSNVKDAGSIFRSSKPDGGLPKTLHDFLCAQVRKQQNEVVDLLKMQIEQLSRTIEERTQLHSETFLASIEQTISQVLHVQDMELKQMNQRNLELQEKVKHLSLETQAWQSKVWTYDTMVTALRANLQQILMQREKCDSKIEGFGDSDNDASSLYIDEAAHRTSASPAMANKAAWQRACKKCKSNEASILLLPCLHLCLCKECCNNIKRCPSCNSPICDRVEVYLS